MVTSANTSIGIGLSILLLHQSPHFIHGFQLSGRSDCRSISQSNYHSISKLQPTATKYSKKRHYCNTIIQLEAQSSKKNDAIDVKIEDKTAGLAFEDDDVENTSAKVRKRDMFKTTLRNLASLSLVDYKWRSALFKKNEADRMEEEWMATMMGEDPTYARPMDADDQRRGPLGDAEKSAVQWLQKVIEEEGKRAKRIIDSDGELVRPTDLDDTEEAGPLSTLERSAIKFLSEISDSEVERVRSGTIRPKDMPNATRSPLGEAEARAVLALDKIIESEKARMDASRRRGGEAVRPIDVPGPLGEFERYVGDMIRSERQRVKDRDANEGKLVRPKDASIQSGLGGVEQKAVDDWEKVKKEESERLYNLRRFLSERRPMESDADSPLGVTETFAVGLLRGPRLLGKVVGRVQELLSSEDLINEFDEGTQQQTGRLPEIKKNKASADDDERGERRDNTGP